MIQSMTVPYVVLSQNGAERKKLDLTSKKKMMTTTPTSTFLIDPGGGDDDDDDMSLWNTTRILHILSTCSTLLNPNFVSECVFNRFSFLTSHYK